MRQYNIFHALWMSFYSRRFYADVLARWTGSGLGYLFFLMALLAIPFAMKIHFWVQDVVDNELPRIIEQLPPMGVQDGRLVTPEDRSYRLFDPDTGKLVAIINPTKEVSMQDSVTVPLFVVEKQQIVIRKSAREMRIYNLSSFEGMAVDKEVINRCVSVVAPWVAWVLYPFVLLFAYIYNIVIALLWALLLFLLGKVMSLGFSYGGALRLVVMAMTPGLIVRIADRWFSINISAVNDYFFVLLTLMYVLLVLVFVRKMGADEKRVNTHNV